MPNAETDYLVIGAGASGLAFADTLLQEADVTVTLVDRRAAAGGHWRQVYPFVRLHTPSAYYGVSSLHLGRDRLDVEGDNAGFYERASGPEVREYFETVAQRLRETGRATFVLEHEHPRDTEAIRVRRRVVDARYLEASIPATHVPSFEVAEDARFIPVNDLPDVATPGDRFAVLGAGKTAVDACAWLLDSGVDPDRIRWIRPRDAWFYDRRHFQPLEQVAGIMEGNALDAEAGAQAESVDDLFHRLEAGGRLLRIDPATRATMFRGTMLSAGELNAVRQIEDVVRLGHIKRIEAGRILLEHGECATGRDFVHVDCTASGLNNAPAQPVFQPGGIVLQQVRHLSPCFNAALIAFVEAHRDDDAQKNRLCPPNAYPVSIEDWPGMTTRTWRAEGRWLREPDVNQWIGSTRLNLMRDLAQHAQEPAVQSAVGRYLTNVQAAAERLTSLAQPVA